MSDHEHWMEIALEEAHRAVREQEVPVGAVFVQDETVIARAHNLCRQQSDPTAHAELLCLKSALNHLDGRLDGGTLFVTLEPCAMCAGACVNAKLPKLVFGAFDVQAGCCGSVLDLCDHMFRWSVEVWGGGLEHTCAALLTAFFEKFRMNEL